jgi:Protein of unknown function (DUF998)
VPTTRAVSGSHAVPAQSRSQSRWTRAALSGAVLYVIIDVVLFVLRPDLSLLHNAESDYGNGPYSWLMDINFELRFSFSIAAATSIWRTMRLGRPGMIGVSLLGVWAVASAVLGFFPDDLQGASPTAHGIVHFTAAGVAFVACLVGTGLLTDDFRRRSDMRGAVPTLAIIWLVAAVGLAVLTRVGFKPHSLGGLFERIFIGAEILWIMVTTALLSRDGTQSPGLSWRKAS